MSVKLGFKKLAGVVAAAGSASLAAGDRSKILYCDPSPSHYGLHMVWQEAIALTIVAMTAAAFVWSRLRPRKFNFQRDTHCGCTSASRSYPRQSIVFRARKGEQATITVRLNP